MKKENQEKIKKVVVNPTPRNSVQGRHKQVFTTVGKSGELIPTKTMQKTKEPDVPTIYMFSPDYSRGKLVTGLEEQIINPFKDREVGELTQEFNLPSSWETLLVKVVTQDRINLQTYFEIIDGVEPDYYTSKITGSIFDGRTDIKNLKDPTFLESFKLVLYDNPNVFTDDNTVKTSRQRIAIQLIKNHSKIAKSRSAANESLHSFYISEENETERNLNKKREIIKNAVKMLSNLQDKHTPYVQYKVASLLKASNNNPILKEKVNSDRLQSLLDDYVMTDGSQQIDNIDKFVSIAGLLSSVEGSIKLDVMYLIQQALNKNVISARDGNFIWHSKSDMVNLYKFTTYDKLVNFFISEYKIFNPKDKDITNWYKELLDEVKIKDVWIE